MRSETFQMTNLRLKKWYPASRYRGRGRRFQLHGVGGFQWPGGALRYRPNHPAAPKSPAPTPYPAPPVVEDKPPLPIIREDFEQPPSPGYGGPSSLLNNTSTDSARRPARPLALQNTEETMGMGVGGPPALEARGVRFQPLFLRSSPWEIVLPVTKEFAIIDAEK